MGESLRKMFVEFLNFIVEMWDLWELNSGKLGLVFLDGIYTGSIHRGILVIRILRSAQFLLYFMF